MIQYIQILFQLKNLSKIICEVFLHFFQMGSLVSSVHFMLTVPIHLDKPHFKGSVAPCGYSAVSLGLTDEQSCGLASCCPVFTLQPPPLRLGRTVIISPFVEADYSQRA